MTRYLIDDILPKKELKPLLIMIVGLFVFSSGEKKRIGLVRIFLKNPKIIVLDEPFSGVDYQARAGIKEAIDGLFADRTLIVISHDEEEKDYGKVLCLENGGVRENRLLYRTHIK